MHMIVLSVELNQTNAKVRTYLFHCCFTDVKQIVVEYTSSIFSNKDQVGLKRTDYAPTSTELFRKCADCHIDQV